MAESKKELGHLLLACLGVQDYSTHYSKASIYVPDETPLRAAVDWLEEFGMPPVCPIAELRMLDCRNGEKVHLPVAPVARQILEPLPGVIRADRAGNVKGMAAYASEGGYVHVLLNYEGKRTRTKSTPFAFRFSLEFTWTMFISIPGEQCAPHWAFSPKDTIWFETETARPVWADIEAGKGAWTRHAFVRDLLNLVRWRGLCLLTGWPMERLAMLHIAR